jgi:hypothetical protein
LHSFCINFALILHRFCINFASILHRSCIVFASIPHRFRIDFASILHQSLPHLDYSLQNGGKGASGGARGNSSKNRNNGQPSQAAAAAADDVCRRFNLGKCPNRQGPCVTSAGVTLKHVCNYRLATGGRCLANHARHTNH